MVQSKYKHFGDSSFNIDINDIFDGGDVNDRYMTRGLLTIMMKTQKMLQTYELTSKYKQMNRIDELNRVYWTHFGEIFSKTYIEINQNDQLTNFDTFFKEFQTRKHTICM